MKGIVLLINEPPNNRKVDVYKYTPLDSKQSNKLHAFPKYLQHGVQGRVPLHMNQSDPQ